MTEFFQTTDATIRQAIRLRLSRAHAGQDAVIVDELKVSLGSGRLDVAVINGRIEGYEIKSDRDSLDRLEKQSMMFGAVADRMTLVVGSRHLNKALEIVPDWWSVLHSTAKSDGKVQFKTVRRGRLNRDQHKLALVETLERDEVIALLSTADLDRGFRTANYRTLADRAASSMSRDDISAFVKKILKVRSRLAFEFGDLAFGRAVIDCAQPFGKDVG
ncbi:sce7726 family protein [Rhizobium sp. BG4]|uniref:sce7726 family protein n=1 Tax=Rhizobium sp. BG4 TaxID=2613770 RepID=UPI00193CC45E|nr:sce7726 family protein [Rhizobium sp. BG4]QRM45775.1 sce7726 family protein [Rhizobium sp. BG4]